jgi:tRNA(Ile)-lysidine synthase
VTGLLAHVEESIHAQKLLSRGQSVMVAVSGGLDSMVLLRLLHDLAASNRWKPTVVHFNHQLRGRSSASDEVFVRQAAAKLGLPFVAGWGAAKSRAQETGQSVEMAAREMRHAFLAQLARARKCRVVALAHHADDQVELFFLRLFRGAGGEGLAGMKWCALSPAGSRLQLIRPLLDVRRADLASFARENRIRFREDASNASLDFRRNRIRHELLPLLESRYQSGLAKTVLRLMEIVGAEAGFVTENAKQWLSTRGQTAFNSLPLAVQRRCVQLQLQRLKVAVDYEMIESLCTCPEQPVSINAAVSVYRDLAGMVHSRRQQSLAFRPEEEHVRLDTGAGEAVFHSVRCEWRVVASRSSTRRSSLKRCEFFDADKVGTSVTLRHWRAGDRFQPIGMAAPVKLQDWFTNRRIPAAQRRGLVLAATAAGEIFWIEGQRISERFKLTADTRRRLVWRWKRA